MLCFKREPLTVRAMRRLGKLYKTGKLQSRDTFRFQRLAPRWLQMLGRTRRGSPEDLMRSDYDSRYWRLWRRWNGARS